MKWLRAFAPVVLALFFASILSGMSLFGRSVPLALIHVTDLSPRDAEPGERMILSGDGFPPGRSARVTFRGTMHRPGEAAEARAEVVVWATAATAEQVELEFTESVRALFCRAGDRAVHTTFEGDVEVAFAAAVAGAPPVAGTLSGAVLDVLPRATGADAARDREGRRVLASLGADVLVQERGAGLRVMGVADGSRAMGAGLTPGDVITSFDGVRVATEGDAIPAPGERLATLGLRLAHSSRDVQRPIGVEGLRPVPPVHWLYSAVFVFAALVAVVLFAAPMPLGPAAIVACAVTRMRAQRGEAAQGNGHSPSEHANLLVDALWASLRSVLPPAAPPALVDAAAVAVLGVLPFGQYVIAAKLDVGVLFLAAATGLVAVALFSRASPAGRVLAAMHVAFQHVPAALAVVTVVFATGSLRVQEIARAEGALPTDWLAFQSPGALAAFVVFVSAMRIDPAPPGEGPGALAWLDDACAPVSEDARGWRTAAARAHGILFAGLGVVLFLGGWSLPWLSPAQVEARPLFELACALVFLVKAASLRVAASFARSALPSCSLSERTRHAALVQLPLALFGLVATRGWTWWSPGHSTELLASACMVVLVAALLLATVHRLRYSVLASTTEARLSSFL